MAAGLRRAAIPVAGAFTFEWAGQLLRRPPRVPPNRATHVLGAVWKGRTIRQQTRPKSGEPIQSPMAANDFSNRPRVEGAPAVQRTQTRRGRDWVAPGGEPERSGRQPQEAPWNS